MMKKFLSFLLCAAMLMGAVSVFTGCDSGGIKIDKNRTQLYVFNYDGGVGSQWLDDVIKRFEKAYADEAFEPGTSKKGVQVIPDNKKTNGVSFTDTLPNSHNNVIFTERVPYYSWASKGLTLDISDVVTEKLPNEDGSIADKLSDETKAMLTVKDGKYFGLPHYEGFWGVSYDIAVFENKDLYYNENGEFVSGYVANGKTEKLSAGPDGVYPSADDGLPASLEQFIALCNKMVDRNIVPFIWSGSYNEYFTMLLDAFSTAWLGKDEAELIYNFNLGGGNVSTNVVTGFNGSTPITQDIVIKESTANAIWQQTGRYYALDMAYRIMNPSANGGKKWYHDFGTDPTKSHLDVQKQFINAPFENKSIGMLVDGNYWENEAKKAIDACGKKYNTDAAKNRRFGWMPLPGIKDGSVGSTKLTLKDSLSSYAVVNANIKNNPSKVRLAKLFLQFVYSDAELKTFTVNTGMTKNLAYDLSAEEVAKMTPFSQGIWAYKTSADIVNTSTTSKLFLNNEGAFTSEFWKTNVGGMNYDRPYNAFRMGKATGRAFFDGMKIDNATWLASNRQYFEEED